MSVPVSFSIRATLWAPEVMGAACAAGTRLPSKSRMHRHSESSFFGIKISPYMFCFLIKSVCRGKKLMPVPAMRGQKVCQSVFQ